MLDEYKNSDIWKNDPDEVSLRSDLLVSKRAIELLGDISDKKVLDAGCGNGKVSRLLANAGASVYGVDSVNDQITTAQGINSSFDTRYFVGDIRDLDTLGIPQDFDIAVSLMAFLYLDDEGFVQAAQQIRKRLKKGGRFIYGNIDPSRFAADQDVYFNKVEKLEASLPTVSGEVFKTTFYRHPYYFVIKSLADAGFKVRQEIKPQETKEEVSLYPMLFPKDTIGKSQYIILDMEAI